MNSRHYMMIWYEMDLSYAQSCVCNKWCAIKQKTAANSQAFSNQPLHMYDYEFHVFSLSSYWSYVPQLHHSQYPDCSSEHLYNFAFDDQKVQSWLVYYYLQIYHRPPLILLPYHFFFLLGATWHWAQCEAAKFHCYWLDALMGSNLLNALSQLVGPTWCVTF